MQSIKIIFFGSTTDSVIILEKLSSPSICQFVNLSICCIVTQPAKPVGRKQVMTPTPVEVWAKAHNIPVLSFPPSPSNPSLFADDQTVIDTLQPFKADLLISASFGQRIPFQAIQAARFGGLNVHPSLLPRWRGADPVPWAILSGDSQTGVTIVTLSETFDSGSIIAQKKIPITDKDFSDPLRTKLFELGAELLVQVLPDYLVTLPSPPLIKRGLGGVIESKYARRLTRDDGFIPWELLQKAMQGEDVPNHQRPKLLSFGICHLSLAIARLWRALHPWPGVWTTATMQRKQQNNKITTEERRVKILACHLSPPPPISPSSHLVLDSVQLEGKTPVSWKQFASAYKPPVLLDKKS